MTTRRVRPLRKRVRLRGHDYASGGGYFITFCTKDFKCFLSRIEEDTTLILGEAGKIVKEEIELTAVIRPNVEIIDYVVMPNHVHIILSLIGDDATGQPHRFKDAVRGSVSTIVSAIKAKATARMRDQKGNPYLELWQDSFHDHVIRDEADLLRIRDYLINNPGQWAEDRYHPDQIEKALARRTAEDSSHAQQKE